MKITRLINDMKNLIGVFYSNPSDANAVLTVPARDVKPSGRKLHVWIYDLKTLRQLVQTEIFSIRRFDFFFSLFI